MLVKYNMQESKKSMYDWKILEIALVVAKNEEVEEAENTTGRCNEALDERAQEERICLGYRSWHCR